MGLYGRPGKALFFDEYVDDHAPKWASNFHPSPIKRENVLYVLDALKKVLPHDRWFLGGSVANPEVAFKDCGDIDIFFYSIEDHTTANAALSARRDCTLDQTSGSADTYIVDGIGLQVQLIKRNVGTPTEIMDTFDLNVARHIVCSDGQRIEGVGDRDLLKVVHPTSATISRMQKYMEYLRYDTERKREAWVGLIDQHMSNDDFVEDYYDENNNKLHNKPFNSLLYNKLKYNKSLKGYLNEKALEHAPELLI